MSGRTTKRGMQMVTVDQQAQHRRSMGKGGRRSSSDNVEYGGQESGLRPGAGPAIRGKMYLNRLVRRSLPRAKGRKSIGVGSGTICRNSPWKSYS